MAAGSNTENVVVDISEDNDRSGKFGVGGYERGSVQIPSAYTGTTLDFEVSNDAGTTWDVVRVAAGTAVGTQTVAVDQIHNIPAEVFMSRWARCVTPAQAADRTLVVHLTGP